MAAKSETVYQGLRKLILTAEIGPGSRLVLDQIAKDFNVSPVPVREAIRRLEAEELVTFTRNIGATVANPNLEAYSHAMETLAVVEGVATSLAAPRLSAADLAAAEQINEAMRAMLAVFDAAKYSALNQEFHEILCRNCPNTHLLMMCERGWERMRMLRRASFHFVPGRAAQSVAEHDMILRLIRDGAPSLDIEMAARQHKLGTLAAVAQRGVGE